MESYDERRRRDEEHRQGRDQDSGRHRDTWWRSGSEHEDDRSRRAERERFSPDWSREGAEPRYSDNPYYSRNRERSDEYSSRGRPGGWQGDERQQWEQRSRESIPRSQRELADRGEPGDYYDPDWPYDRERGRQRNVERSPGEQQRSSGREDEGSHYRGVYTRSGGPFSYAGGQGYAYAESLTVHGPYAGRGPKGYKRSDQQIVEDACQRLERDGEIDASEIEVTAEDGVIRLRGTVHDRRTKRRAEECVESIYGAHDVMNELRVSKQQGQGHGSQDSQGASQSGRGSSQTSQSGQGTQASQATQTPGQRPGAGSASSDQLGDDKRTPRH